jgi:hypothetical protein
MAKQLTQEEENKLFRKIADAHISLSNTQMNETELHVVTSGALYGAARFTAFYVAYEAEKLTKFEETKAEAIEHYTSLFKTMLEANIESYKESFTPAEETPAAPSPYNHLMKNINVKVETKS